MAKRPVKKYDFKPYGAASKAARTERKESRKKACDAMLDGMSDEGIRIVMATAREIMEIEQVAHSRTEDA